MKQARCGWLDGGGTRRDCRRGPHETRSASFDSFRFSSERTASVAAVSRRDRARCSGLRAMRLSSSHAGDEDLFGSAKGVKRSERYCEAPSAVFVQPAFHVWCYSDYLVHGKNREGTKAKHSAAPKGAPGSAPRSAVAARKCPVPDLCFHSALEDLPAGSNGARQDGNLLAHAWSETGSQRSDACYLGSGRASAASEATGCWGEANSFACVWHRLGTALSGLSAEYRQAEQSWGQRHGATSAITMNL